MKLRLTPWKVELRKVLRLAWPIALGNLSHMLMSLIDSVMIGRLGTEPLAAVSFSGALFGFLIIASVGMSAAISPLVAKAKGAEQEKECGQVLWHGLFLNTLFGLLLISLLYLAIYKIDLFDQPASVVPLAKEYLLITAPSILLVLISNTYRQYSEGLSNAHTMMLFSFLMLFLNTFFNWLLIFGNWGLPAYGVAGAAMGTLATRLILTSSVALYVHHARFFEKYRIRFNELVWSKEKFREHLSIGLPSSLQYSAEASAFTGAAIIMGWIDAVSLASHQIAINLASMTFMFALGTSVAAGVRVGEAYGAKNIPQARLSGFTSIFSSAVFLSLFGVFFYFARHWLPTLYINDPKVIELAAKLLVIAALFQLFDSSQAVAIGALRGLLDAKWPTLITIIAYWGFSLPLGYALAIPYNWGAVGVWWALALGLAISSLSLTWRFHILTRSMDYKYKNTWNYR